MCTHSPIVLLRLRLRLNFRCCIATRGGQATLETRERRQRAAFSISMHLKSDYSFFTLSGLQQESMSVQLRSCFSCMFLLRPQTFNNVYLILLYWTKTQVVACCWFTAVHSRLTHLDLNAQKTKKLHDKWTYDRVNLYTVRACYCFDVCFVSLISLVEISCLFVSVKHKAFGHGLGFVPLAIPTPSSNVLQNPFLMTSLQCKAEGLTEVVWGIPSGTIAWQVPCNTKWSMMFTFTAYCIRKEGLWEWREWRERGSGQRAVNCTLNKCDCHSSVTENYNSGTQPPHFVNWERSGFRHPVSDLHCLDWKK